MVGTRSALFNFHQLMRGSKAQPARPAAEDSTLVLGPSYEYQDTATLIDDSLMNASQVSLPGGTSLSSETGGSGYSCPGSSVHNSSLSTLATVQEPVKNAPPPVPSAPSVSLHARAQTLRKQLQSPYKPPKCMEPQTHIINEELIDNSPPELGFKPDTFRSSHLRARREKRRSYMDHRLSTFSMASSIAVLAPYIAVPDDHDDASISQFLPEAECTPEPSSHDNGSLNGDSESQPKAKNGISSKKLFSRSKAGNKLGTARITAVPDNVANLTNEVVAKLGQDLDKQFSSFDVDMGDEEDFTLHSILELEIAETQGRRQRILNWYHRHKPHFSIPRITKTRNRSHECCQSQSLPRDWGRNYLPSDIKLDMSPIPDLPSLGDLGSPPMTLRAQTLPAH